MVAVPTVTPVTTPLLLTVALLLLLLHAPPLAALDNVMVEPVLTLDEPVIEPALGVGFTVTTAVAELPPQLLLTV
jgi:hypothetical protein